jgi:hypothetical protein
MEYIMYITGIAVSSKARYAKRKNLIKCCGRNSCSNVMPKRKLRIQKKNETMEIAGNFKINRQMTTPGTLVDNDGNQKISSVPPQETPENIVDDTKIEENLTRATADGTSLNLGPQSSKMDSTVVHEQTVSTDGKTVLTDGKTVLNEELPTKMPLVGKASSLIPAASTTNLIFAELSSSGEILKGIKN